MLTNASGQISFKEQLNIPAVTKAITCVEDFTGDQAQDLLISGFDGQAFTHRVYKNENGEFATNKYSTIEVLGQTLSAHAIDYNNNGLLDVLISSTDKGIATVGIYENKGNIFKKLPSVLDVYSFDSLISLPVNYNQDLYTDFLLFGLKGKNSSVLLFENLNGSTFLEHKLTMGNNPRLDVSISKSKITNQPQILWSENVNNVATTSLYEIANTGKLIDQKAKLPLLLGKTLMLDVDADNDLDIYVNGVANGKLFHGFLTNSNNDFNNPKFVLPAVRQSNIAFHDINNDGFVDAILGGKFPSDSSLVKIFTNTGNSWSVGKTISITENAHIDIATLKEINTSNLLIMGVENGNKYIFNKWKVLDKSHTLVLNSNLSVKTIENTATIKWVKPSSSLPTSTIGYDFRISKNDKLQLDFQTPSLFSYKVFQSDSASFALPIGNYRFELRAFDNSGKISNIKDITFNIQNQPNLLPFEIVAVSGMEPWVLDFSTRILDIDQDGKQDILALTKNNISVPLIQSAPNYFVAQKSFPASALDLSATYTTTFNTYYLDKGILYKYDLTNNSVKTTGIVDILSFSVFDMDNDGDDDLYVYSSKELKGIIYRYEEGEFQKLNKEILDKLKVPWKVADLNNDGYLDLITKIDSGSVFKHYIGWNVKGDSIKWEKLSLDNNELTDILDFDNDGKLEFVGYNNKSNSGYSHLIYYYKNNILTLSPIGFILPLDEFPPEDIKIINLDDEPKKEFIYFKNDSLYVLKDTGGYFVPSLPQALGFPYTINAIDISPYIDVADFDNDKKLDIFLQYKTKEGYQTLILYNRQKANAAPTNPTNLKSEIKQGNATLRWSSVPNAKSYKIEFWTKKEKIINAGIISEGNVYTNTLPSLGSIYDTVYQLSNLPSETYFWKVYAIIESQVSPPSATNSFSYNSYISKNISSINDTARYGDFGGQQFSHPCDFDNDGDLDFLFLATGRDTVVGSMSFIGGNFIFINNGDGSFKTQKVNIQDLYTSDVAFFDYNKDGYQDIAITAVGLYMANTHWETKPFISNSTNFFTKIYINDKKNNFFDSKVILPSIGMGNIDVADYNQDGHQDLLISGRNSIAKLGDTPRWFAFLATYNKDSTNFKIEKLYENSIYNIYSQFQDTDVDGDYDIFLLGRSTTANKVTQIIVNKNGSFYENKILNKQETSIEEHDIDYFDFGDFDRDGDQDLVICGTNFINVLPTEGNKEYTERNVPISVIWDMKIYTNLGNNVFAPSGLSIDGLLSPSRMHKLKWLDFNNDGQLEIVTQFDHRISMIVQKTDKNFKVSELWQINDSCTYTTFGDFNKDSKIDFVIGGQRSAFKCLLSNIENSNAPPAILTKLTSIVLDNQVNLKWERTVDDNTNIRSLKYAVELYDKNGLIYSNANFKTIPTEDYDNYFYSTNRTFKNLKDGSYYWRVAAMDDNYNISNFSKLDSFKIALRPVISGPLSVCNFEKLNYTVSPSQVSQACNGTNLPCPRYRWEIQNGSGILSYQDSSYNQVSIKWVKDGKHFIKVTNPIYKMDTTLQVEVKFNPIPRIRYVFVDDASGGRTLKFKDSLATKISKYSWKFGESINAIDTTSNPIFTFPESGIYSVTLTVQYDSSGCVNSYKRNVDLQNPKIDGRPLVCKGDSVWYKVGPKNFKYNWKVENGTIVKDTALAIRVVWNNVGIGSITATSTTAITSLSDSIRVIISDVPIAKITIPESLGTNSQIKFRDSVSSDVIQFDWKFGERDKEFKYSSPIVEFEQSGPHLISFTATNKMGCSINIKETVQVTENLVPIEVSNLLTQNNDGFNDYLFVKNIDRFPDSEVLLYSPWGKLLYSATAYQNDWKPGSNGVEVLLAGSYLCVVYIKSMDKKFEQIITVLQ